jgi:hypothetical protein
MTKKIEHYIGQPKIHKSPATSLDPEPDTKDKHTTRPGLPRTILATYFTEAKHAVRFLLAPGP